MRVCGLRLLLHHHPHHTNQPVRSTRLLNPNPHQNRYKQGLHELLAPFVALSPDPPVAPLAPELVYALFQAFISRCVCCVRLCM